MQLLSNKQKYAILNNATTKWNTIFYDINGNKKELEINAGDIVWISEE